MSFGHHKLDRERMGDDDPAEELAAAVGDFLTAWRAGAWSSRLTEHVARLERALKSWRSRT